MEINQFIKEVENNLELLDFIEQIIIEQRSFTYTKIKVLLYPKGFINIWYNSVRGTQSFSIIIDNSRKWGFDYDNRIGWHEHLLDNKEHIAVKEKSISEILNKLENVWNTIIK